MTTNGRGHGGKRPGAGRPRSTFRIDAPHRSRETFDSPAPVHVTMRCPHIAALRWQKIYEALHGVLARFVDGEQFRVVHLSIQSNHLHAIVEAASSNALERGMRRFTIAAARAINAAFASTGRVFARYHSRVIRTRRYARHVIAYVLGNWRRHREDSSGGRLTAMLDRFSSAVTFDGWSRPFSIPAEYRPLPVSAPRTDLMRRGWAYAGPLDPYDIPGPPR